MQSLLKDVLLFHVSVISISSKDCKIVKVLQYFNLVMMVYKLYFPLHYHFLQLISNIGKCSVTI